MISNTTSISPTDIWKLSDRYIKPEMGDQYSIGLYNNFGRRAIEHLLKLITRICKIFLTTREARFC